MRFGPDVPMIPDIGPGSVDARVYLDPQQYDRERALVLGPSWQVICRSSEIENPGDFITWAGQGETILVTRRRDGSVSGFHNVSAPWSAHREGAVGVRPPVAHLHANNTKPQDVRDGRFSTYFVFGRHGMMVIPYKGVLQRLRDSLDHQRLAICHYTLFPTAVFNCNPTHIQLFRSVPLTVDTSRFECWKLQYADDAQVIKVNEHWARLTGVVSEDVEIWDEVAATRQSSGYRCNILNDRECKITAFHRTVQAMLDDARNC